MLTDNDFPGADLIARGLDDLRLHRYTIHALIVAIGAPRLRALALDLPPDDQLPECPEHRLYDLLASSEPQNAHASYNALIRRLVSYEHARELALARTIRAVG